MKKWLVRALCYTSYFIISRAFLPLHCMHVCLLLSDSLSPSLSLPLSSSSLSESVAPLFLLEPHARGRLELCEGRKKKKTKSLLLFLQSGPPRSPPCHRWIFFFFLLTTSWILTLCLQLAAQQLCKTWQQVAFFRGPFLTFGTLIFAPLWIFDHLSAFLLLIF